ncbi:hypothetical protein RND71_033920 [Anisodus tanguticus]|uniref:Uncharacterized protein n=1 Tax=Anisodus tanguticus TaxID=243964 RepID=A0AAE1R963_9SOLA|nr:hypothetical protein RND71_033920 [Anisodus tanguticus]
MSLLIYPCDVVIVHLFDGRSFDGQIESYDFHYNVAAIKILSDTPLPIASLAHISDSITIFPSQLQVTVEKPFQLGPHSNSFDLIPGDSVIALSRFYAKPYNIMAAPGLLEYEIQEFKMTLSLVDQLRDAEWACDSDSGFDKTILFYRRALDSGRIIGSLARQVRRPWLGMEVTNLYAARLHTLEQIISKFPDVLEGVIVEELFECMWNNVGESVELAVIRASHDVPVHLSMIVEWQILVGRVVSSFASENNRLLGNTSWNSRKLWQFLCIGLQLDVLQVFCRMVCSRICSLGFVWIIVFPRDSITVFPL